MRVIPPVDVTSAILTSTNVPEPDTGEAIYNAGTTYGLGDTVISTTTHRKYESLQATGNQNKPLPALGVTATEWWVDVGPTNRYKMFDLYRSTATTRASSIAVTITPGRRINSIALVGLVGDQVVIEAVSGGVTVFTETIMLRRRRSTGWYSYWYGAFSPIPTVARFNLPPYSNVVLNITITGTGTVACGSLVIGNFVYLGGAQYGAEADSLNFSKIERDAFGNATLVPRRAVPKTTQRVRCDKNNVNRVRELRSLTNAVPAFWAAVDNSDDGYFEAFLVIGIWKQFAINADFPGKAMITLELEEI